MAPDPSPGLLHLTVCSRHTVHVMTCDSRGHGLGVHRSVLTGAFKTLLELSSASESGLRWSPLLAPRRVVAGHQGSQKDVGLTSIPLGLPLVCPGTAEGRPPRLGF